MEQARVLSGKTIESFLLPPTTAFSSSTTTDGANGVSTPARRRRKGPPLVASDLSKTIARLNLGRGQPGADAEATPRTDDEVSVVVQRRP